MLGSFFRRSADHKQRVHRKQNVAIDRIYCASKVKVNVILVQALRLCTGLTAYRGSRGIDPLFHDESTSRGEGSASRPGRSLPLGKARYALYRRLTRARYL
jgi:hypothetical protein